MTHTHLLTATCYTAHENNLKCHRYIKCLYVYNKVDMISLEDMDALARLPNSIVASVYMKLNLDKLLEQMWEYMGLIRIYTKKKGHAPDLAEPVILSGQRRGVNVEAATMHISKEMKANFNYALVWGKCYDISLLQCFNTAVCMLSLWNTSTRVKLRVYACCAGSCDRFSQALHSMYIAANTWLC
jgi:C-terminal region of MMR_HSR1 domain/TGS domain